MAFMRESILAALITKLPLPQIPITPIRFRSTKGWVARKSTAALKFGIDVRGNGIARQAVAFAPERQVQRQCYESLLGHLRGVQISGLLVRRPHRVSDNDRWLLGISLEILGNEEIPYNLSFDTGFRKRPSSWSLCR
jgi:hypothetical protein